MNGTSGFEEVQSSTPDHQPIGSCTSNGIDSKQIPGTTYASQLTKQASMHATRRIVLLCLSILILFSGCSSFSSTLGYRPEFSTTSPTTSTPACRLELLNSDKAAAMACEEYYTAVKWGEDVAQAYKTKAFINEWSVYIAGGVGIIGGAVVGSLTATEQGNTDAAKIIPLVTAAVASLFALNQSDDKATAYGESIIAIEESLAAADRYVSHAKNKTIAGFQLGSDSLKDSIRQEIVNLANRMVAIRKKTDASIPTTTGLFPESFKSPVQPQLSFIIGTTNLETDPEGIRAIIVPDTDVTIKVEKVENGHVFLTLTNLKCQDYLVMLSVRNKLVLPARNLRCE